MSDLDEIRTRLGALEDEVARLRDDAAATRTLAALADRDASEVRGALKALTQALSALRETQVEQGKAQNAHGRTLETIAQAVGAVATEQAQQREALTELTTLVRHLSERDA